MEFEDKYVPAELCLPGQRPRGAIALRALLDSGAHFTSLSLPIVEMMERMFPGVQLRVPFSLGARQAITATGQKVSVTERTIPLQLALVTPSGPAPLPPISFAIMPGSDGVLLLGLPTLKDLGVDPYERIRDSMQQRVSPPNQGVETPALSIGRRVSLSVAALQEAGGQATEEPDLAVERLVERGPEMFMDPAEEESARKVALEESVTDAVAQGLSVSQAKRLGGILCRRFNAFRRALRGDPPARVEPMCVQLKPGASAVKAKPRRYDPVKTRWLASCVAALLAFGLVFRNLQAVGSSTAMAVAKRDSVRSVGDLLSRWVSVAALPVRAVAIFSPCDQDDSMPSKAVVRQAQQKALATDGTEVPYFESAVGRAVLDDEGLFGNHARGRMFCGFRILTSSCNCA